MIEIRNISKTYSGKQVLSDVSFTAENGLVTGFVGPNGAGKSTTMRMISALETPDSGIALVDGKPFSQVAAPARVMGVYLGSDYLPSNMSANRYLSYICRVNKLPKSRIPEMLERVELSQASNRTISEYSLGMKQRAGLAASLIGDPTTIMLDEPVNGLDPMGVQWLRKVIKEEAAKGRAVLLSSHLLSELELVADKIVMLDGGRVVSQGFMKDLERSNSGQLQVIVHTNDDAGFARILSSRNIPFRHSDEGLVVSFVAPEQLAYAAVAGNFALYHLEQKRASLEEMFMAQASGQPTAPQAPPAIQVAPRQAPQPRQAAYAQPQPVQQAYPQQAPPRQAPPQMPQQMAPSRQVVQPPIQQVPQDWRR